MNRTAVFLAALFTAAATAASAQTRAADWEVSATRGEAQDPPPPQDQAAPPNRPKRFDSFAYARLGYGGVFGDGFTGGPALGFGFRGSFDSFGVDVSFFNFKVPGSGSGIYGSSGSSLSGSLLKLEGLYFLKPKADATVYVGGGFSYGGTDVGGAYGTNNIQTSWHGSGLQGELTAGYEWPRANALRMFVQADATLPFYNVTSEQITFSDRPFGGFTSTTDHRYSASLVVSVGLGWQRGRHARP